LQIHIGHVVQNRSNYGLKVTNYCGGAKGRRVYNEVKFYHGECLALYPGNFISNETAEELDALFTSMKSTDSYMISLKLPALGWLK
jgi:hypothetical protein